MGQTQPMDTDPDLLRRYADSRDQAAFAELVNRHLGLVHATALRVLGGDTHLAQDVAQGAFAELARQARALGGRDTLAGWLHHTARFLALNAVRAERRRREREQEAHAMNETDTTPDAAWAKFAPVLDEAVAALDDADRDALLLRFFEDKSHREVGAQLGLAEDAARMRVARALDKLRAHFSKRGVTTTAALLSLTLGVHGSTPAPAGLAASVMAKALSTATGGAVAVGAVKTILTAKRLVAVAAVVLLGGLIFYFWPSSEENLSADSPVPVFDPVFESATVATNRLGVELFRLTAKPGENFLLSPYSIQSALAMTYAGADGETRAEMARVLHFPPDDTMLAESFAKLRAALDATVTASTKYSAQIANDGGKVDVVEWRVANQLFGQTGYEFHQPFLDFVRDRYDAPLQLLDFGANPRAARNEINRWVADRTKEKIPDLIPRDGITPSTRLVLVNALYLKAPWETPFNKELTEEQPFKVRGTTLINVPTMRKGDWLGYAKRKGYTAITLPYPGGELQFLILLPDDPAGVDALAAIITPAVLRANAQLATQLIALRLPRFKLKGPTVSLGERLQKLGMKTAFDVPVGSANFDRMAPRKPDYYLSISEVYHRTFLNLDEEGTEAAAATAIGITHTGGIPPPLPKPIEVRVDHPFLFAIQHRESGVCLFLGRVTDPR
jgi:serpin B